MEIIIFGILAFIGLLWQMRQIQKLIDRKLWNIVWDEIHKILPFILLLLFWYSFFKQGSHISIPIGILAFISCIIYVLITALIFLRMRETKIFFKNPTFVTTILVPMFLGGLVSLGVTINSCFEIPELDLGKIMLKLTATDVVINGLFFAFLFQIKAAISPMIVCLNVAYCIYSYLHHGVLKVWSLMENILLLIMEPSAAAYNAPWYTLTFFVLTIIATGWDLLNTTETLN